MARRADGAGKIRAELEGALLALAVWGEAEPFIRLRISQAIRRDPRLANVLSPALAELDGMCQAVMEARSQVSAATVKLMER
jgi:hypothetical protein